MFIYGPLYVEAFMTKNSKSFWQSMILIANPIGTCVGYAFTGTMLIYEVHWTITPILVTIAMIASIIVLLFIPTKYLDLDKVHQLT